jgi:hypothetical protein
MMDDHYTISAARNALVDALQALLKADIMTAEDFRAARHYTAAALAELDDLLGQQPDLFAAE